MLIVYGIGRRFSPDIARSLPELLQQHTWSVLDQSEIFNREFVFLHQVELRKYRKT